MSARIPRRLPTGESDVYDFDLDGRSVLTVIVRRRDDTTLEVGISNSNHAYTSEEAIRTAIEQLAADMGVTPGVVRRDAAGKLTDR